MPFAANLTLDEKLEAIDAHLQIFGASVGGFLTILVVSKAHELAALANATYDLDKERWLREAFAKIVNIFPEPARSFFLRDTDAFIGTVLKLN